MNLKKKGRGYQVRSSPTKWAKRKIKRNSGQAYMSSLGKLVPAKTTKNVICSCKFKYCKELLDDPRKNEFRKFWALGDINEQNTYLLLQIKSFNKKSKKNSKRWSTEQTKGKKQKLHNL